MSANTERKAAEDKKRFAVLFVRRVPKQLKASFKSHCAKREVSMHAKLLRFMKECVAQDAV